MFRRAYCDSYLELQSVQAEVKKEVRTIVFPSPEGDFLPEAGCGRVVWRAGNVDCVSVRHGEDDDAGRNGEMA